MAGKVRLTIGVVMTRVICFLWDGAPALDIHCSLLDIRVSAAAAVVEMVGVVLLDLFTVGWCAHIRHPMQPSGHKDEYNSNG